MLYGWKVSWVISESGQWSAGLISDRHITEGGNVNQLALWVTNGNQADQWKFFSKETIPAQSIHAVACPSFQMIILCM